jgi:hypothetical protein
LATQKLNVLIRNRVILNEGVYFLYKKSLYQIYSKLPDKIGALDVISKSLTFFEYDDIKKFHEMGEIQFIEFKSKRKEKNERGKRISEREKKRGELRYKIIKPLLNNPHMTVDELIGLIYENKEFQDEITKHNFSFSKASIYRWVKKYRLNNNDKVSLVTDYNQRYLSKKSRIADAVLEILDRHIIAAHLKRGKISAVSIYNFVSIDIQKRNVLDKEFQGKTPSLAAVTRRINEILLILGKRR